jgi:pimeloyl-ACP methyl ester carboxylesterase
MRSLALGLVLLFFAASAAFAESLPRALYVDPPEDAHHPARFEVLHIPSGGVEINGIAYVPAGPGPHPTAVLLHGMPGNEKNLDLAQAMRRAGWLVIAFNYRGSWGSPGAFHFAQTLDDADAVLAYLRQPDSVAKLGVDTNRLVMIGHSMGGWITLQTLAHDKGLLGAAVISPADLALIAAPGRDAALSFILDDRESIAETDNDALADEMMAHADDWKMAALAPQLTDRRLLVLYSHDAYQAHALSLIESLKAAKSKSFTAAYTATDHAWSDHRIALQAQVLNWLANLPAK